MYAAEAKRHLSREVSSEKTKSFNFFEAANFQTFCNTTNLSRSSFPPLVNSTPFFFSDVFPNYFA